jgi:2-dehydropantoate 2-reductase
MRALIYGGGAVGLGIASCLILSGEEVDIIAREETVSALRRDGLGRTGIFGSVEFGPEEFGAYASLDDLFLDESRRLRNGGVNLHRDHDYVLVATKSSGSEGAAADLSRHPEILAPAGNIVLFQNGWGNAEIFAAHIPKERVYSARVITGFQRKRENVVDFTVHADPIHLGSLFDADLTPMVPLAEAISRGGIPTEVVEDVGKDLWAKMLYNCALNPLGAIFGVPYGDLAEVEASRELMGALIREIFSVMEAAGYETHWSTPEEYIVFFHERLLPPTASHESSTLQDIRAGKTTEIEALSGAVVRLGEEHGVPAPTNAALYRMILFMEAKSPLKAKGDG